MVGSRLAIAFIVTVAVAACSDSSSGPHTPPNPNGSGSYTIATVNGNPPPVAIFSDTNFKEEFTAGSVTLTSDGKYSIVQTTRWTVPGNVSTYVDSTGGTWTLSGTTVQFTNGQDTSKDQATLANGRLTFVEVTGTVTNTYIYALK